MPAADADKEAVLKALKELCILVFLGINSCTDLKKKQISMAVVGIFGAGALGRRICTGQLSWELLVPAGMGSFFWQSAF